MKPLLNTWIDLGEIFLCGKVLLSVLVTVAKRVVNIQNNGLFLFGNPASNNEIITVPLYRLLMRLVHQKKAIIIFMDLANAVPNYFDHFHQPLQNSKSHNLT